MRLHGTMCSELLLLTALALVSSATGQRGLSLPNNDTSTCSKPWFVWRNNSCKCGSSLGGIVSCQDDPASVQLSQCYCITVDSHTGDSAVGSCPYSCVVPVHWYQNESQLNYYMCTETWNRQGQLCSQCIDGHGPPVYSYSMQCIPCSPKVVRDSIVWFLVSFLPLTVFCLTIITLRISVARPPMSTFILVSQVMSAPQFVSEFLVPGEHNSYISSYVSNNRRNMCLKLFVTFFGLSNLDIFRSFYPQLCLSPHMSKMQATSMEYLTAVFPLAMVILVYVSVKFYNSYRVFRLCRPVIFGLARLRQTINIQSSLVDAFATFIILSLIKIGYTSLVILHLVRVFTPYGNYTTKAYADPTMTYFGWEHLPYALTALVLTLVLILIPLLLLFLYPLRSFQTFLNNRQWQCTTLHIFADSFHGCYKDGTNGTRDYRWFAGLHLLLRFAIVLVYYAANYQKIVITLMAITISFYMAILAVCQPYKKYIHLKLDMILLFGLLLGSVVVLISVLGYDGPSTFSFWFHLSLLILTAFIPFAYIVGLSFHWVIFRKRLHLRIINKLTQTFQRSEQTARLLDSSA